ncbi:MAG: prolipoprotein diacylglyceryl transferase [Alteraurantiacibacter sp.]
MIDYLAAGAGAVTNWADLGLKPGIDLGFFTLRYYSLAYLAGLLLAAWHLSKMIKAPGAPMAQRHVEDLFFYCMLGVILGGRLGYAAFYDHSLWTGFAGDGFVSWKLLRLWDGGMSFHGGVLGVLLAIAWVSRKGGLPFLRVADYIAVNVGFGMFFGRLANFINGELWGRAAGEGVPWAMSFCDLGRDAAGTCLSTYTARHPSQLYEAVLEGLVVMVVLITLFWRTGARYRPGLLVGLFTALIGLGRFTVEFFREPDAQLAEFAASTGLNMGQWLTIPLIATGAFFVVRALRRPPLASGYVPPAD